MTDFGLPALDWRHKAFRAEPESHPGERLEILGLPALDGGLMLPVMTLNRESLTHNINVMARFCADHGVDLAPHAKTTMSPELIGRQIDAGAWGMTAATVSQARVLSRFGVENIVIASQVLDIAGISWICETQDADPRVSICAVVDSLDSVALMEHRIATLSPGSRIRVLVELGYDGGRAGARTQNSALEVARALAQSPSLALIGVEGFEGMMPGPDLPTRRASVAAYLADARAFTESCLTEGLFGADLEHEPLVTFGGSAFHDLVVQELPQSWAAANNVRVVLRSGCYITHDHGLYAETSPWSEGPSALRAAVEVWGIVLSLPEPGRAILGFGRRDVGSDAGFPRVLWRRRDGVNEAVTNLTISALNDQHAYVDIRGDGNIGGGNLRVGDLLGCGISHPCTTFDKWSMIPEVDSHYRVVGAVHTFF